MNIAIIGSVYVGLVSVTCFAEIKSQLITHIIFDGRNQYQIFNLNEKCFENEQIGKK